MVGDLVGLLCFGLYIYVWTPYAYVFWKFLYVWGAKVWFVGVGFLLFRFFVWFYGFLVGVGCPSLIAFLCSFVGGCVLGGVWGLEVHPGLVEYGDCSMFFARRRLLTYYGPVEDVERFRGLAMTWVDSILPGLGKDGVVMNFTKCRLTVYPHYDVGFNLSTGVVFISVLCGGLVIVFGGGRLCGYW